MSAPGATLSRRRWIQRMGAVGLGGVMTGRVMADDSGETVALPFANGTRRLVAYPQKRPLLVLSARPPQLETPFQVFNESVLTPNDAFFVRYHLANIPLSIDDGTFRLAIKGAVATPLQLSVADLKKGFEHVEVTAVAQCSGNSRGFVKPRVGGGQLGNGAMGCARWGGVRLKDVLARAGLDPKAKQVSFNGLDAPVMPQTPDFLKALNLEQIQAGDVMLAHSMNGEPLPMLNGFPLRLVVPGYYATYWVKHVHEIEVLTEPFGGFWVAGAYRIPNTANACIDPGTAPKSTVPINVMNVRSFITSHADGATVASGQPVTVRGIAFDGGEGIREVLFSPDDGQTWQSGKLGEDHGKFSFREWTHVLTPTAKGVQPWRVRAVNRIGQSQPFDELWNPAGYMRNVVETVHVNVA